MSYYAGKEGKLTIGGSPQEVAVKSWKATHSIQELDTTSTTSGGKYEVQGGIEKVEGSFEADWEPSNGPFNDGLGISAGTNLTNVKLYVFNGSGGPVLTMPKAFVKSVDVEVGVDAVVKYTVNFTSNGTFTLPA